MTKRRSGKVAITTTSRALVALAKQIERDAEVADDDRDELEQLRRENRGGDGFIVHRLLGLAPGAFKSEVDVSEMDLFHRLIPLLWPRCLTWLSRYPTNHRTLLRECLDDADQGTIAMDIESLETLHTMIGKTIAGLKKAAKPPTPRSDADSP